VVEHIAEPVAKVELVSTKSNRGGTELPNGKWRSRIMFENDAYNLGVFNSSNEASTAYDIAHRELMNGNFLNYYATIMASIKLNRDTKVRIQNKMNSADIIPVVEQNPLINNVLPTTQIKVNKSDLLLKKLKSDLSSIGKSNGAKINLSRFGFTSDVMNPASRQFRYLDELIHEVSDSEFSNEMANKYIPRGGKADPIGFSQNIKSYVPIICIPNNDTKLSATKLRLSRCKTEYGARLSYLNAKYHYLCNTINTYKEVESITKWDDKAKLMHIVYTQSNNPINLPSTDTNIVLNEISEISNTTRNVIVADEELVITDTIRNILLNTPKTNTYEFIDSVFEGTSKLTNYNVRMRLMGILSYHPNFDKFKFNNSAVIHVVQAKKLTKYGAIIMCDVNNTPIELDIRSCIHSLYHPILTRINFDDEIANISIEHANLIADNMSSTDKKKGNVNGRTDMINSFLRMSETLEFINHNTDVTLYHSDREYVYYFFTKKTTVGNDYIYRNEFDLRTMEIKYANNYPRKVNKKYSYTLSDNFIRVFQESYRELDENIIGFFKAHSVLVMRYQPLDNARN
jgi:hypothetical protein